jgi:hypothetical protein
VGYSPFDNFNLKYVIWDVATNREICMQLFDIVSLQLYLNSVPRHTTDYELTTAFVRQNRNDPNLFHIIEKSTHKMLSFHSKTLMNLVHAKQLYQFNMSRPDIMEKADECVEILSELKLSHDINVENLDNYYENICEKTATRDRIFLGELINKFPSTFIATITHC